MMWIKALLTRWALRRRETNELRMRVAWLEGENNRLIKERADLQREIREIKWIKDDLDPIGPTLAKWFNARVAVASRPHNEPQEVAERNRATLDNATLALDAACRRAFLMPGMRGSWGRGVPRTWECEFDPERNGCECAGGGMTEAETRTCFYRAPIGDKKGAKA